MDTKKFQRNIEDFTCEHCGKEVKGSGYTNHCPYCLWSKHVDINPGDRAETCQGIMEPVATEQKGDMIILVHKCQTCRQLKKNKMNENDSFEQMLEIARNRKEI